MNHDAELARLPAWARPIIAALLEHPQGTVMAKLGVSINRMTWVRRLGWRTLGKASPLMLAATGWRSGPKPGRRGPTGMGEPPVALLTTPGPDGHVHVARFNDLGNGRTDLVAGHQHRVLGLELAATNGHAHELTDRRA